MCNKITGSIIMDKWTTAYKCTAILRRKEYTGMYSNTQVQYRKVMVAKYEKRGVFGTKKTQLPKNTYGFCVFPTLADARLYSMDIIRRVEVKGKVYMGEVYLGYPQRGGTPMWMVEKMRMFGKVKDV